MTFLLLISWISQQVYATQDQKTYPDISVPISGQIITQSTTESFQIVVDQIRLIRDETGSGNLNKAIDAGETITINVPVKNQSGNSLRSTSGFLQSDDKYVKIKEVEAVYAGKDLVSGKTTTFASGTVKVPTANYQFSISEKCPDGHLIQMSLLIWDSDYGKHSIPFQIKVYHVGPLDVRKVRIDDDIPGLSDGNGDGRVDPGETIEYVLTIENKGTIPLSNVSALLRCKETQVQFLKGYDKLQYETISSSQTKLISASYVFKMMASDWFSAPDILHFELVIKGFSRNHQYIWIPTAPTYGRTLTEKMSREELVRLLRYVLVEKKRENGRDIRLGYRSLENEGYFKDSGTPLSDINSNSLVRNNLEFPFSAFNEIKMREKIKNPLYMYIDLYPMYLENKICIHGIWESQKEARDVAQILLALIGPNKK
jgi:hypothetical protein